MHISGLEWKPNSTVDTYKSHITGTNISSLFSVLIIVDIIIYLYLIHNPAPSPAVVSQLQNKKHAHWCLPPLKFPYLEQMCGVVTLPGTSQKVYRDWICVPVCMCMQCIHEAHLSLCDPFNLKSGIYFGHLKEFLSIKNSNFLWFLHFTEKITHKLF